MQWIVEGADAENGQDTSITVDADNRIHAETVARRQGILVSSVRRASSPADALEAMFGPPLIDANTPAQPPTKPAAPTTSRKKSKPPVRRDISASSIVEGLAVPVDYQTPAVNESSIPRYLGLKFAGTVLGVLCVPAYVIGAAGLVYALLAFVQSGIQGYSTNMIVAGLLSLLGSAYPLVVGALLHALSSACFALRDIAQSCRRMESNR